MLGIYDLNICSNLDYKARLDIYKNAGFKEFALYLDDAHNRPEESYLDIINYARLIDLKVRQVHIDYNIANMYDEETTNRYLTYLSEKLDEALKLNIPYVVAHASKSDTPPNLTQDQIDKFTQMMSKFAGTDVYLCLENVRVNENLTTLLSLNLPNVGFCYDLGHAHSYGDTEKIFKQFEKHIKCSHIHNNFGKDTHEIPTRGEIDCKLYVEKLRQIEGTSNCLECFPPRGSNLSREDFVLFVEELYREASQL